MNEVTNFRRSLTPKWKGKVLPLLDLRMDPAIILEEVEMPGSRAKLVGLDLAGSVQRPTGICFLEGNQAKVSVLYTDEEILRAIGEDVRSVAIDAPLSLPKGRCCLRNDCDCCGKAHFRLCDLELRKMKIKFFPVTLGPMRQLTVRGMALKNKLEARGLRVFETYPGAAQDIWGIPRQKDLKGLRQGLQRFKVRGNWLGSKVTKHELDALTCALVAREDLRGRAFSIGDPKEGLMILPREKSTEQIGKRMAHSA